jgi:hypothetical protein
MRIDTSRLQLPLGPRGHAQLRKARGVRLTGLAGMTWITVDGVADDVFIGLGESFVVPSAQTVVAVALQGCALVEISGRAGAIRSLTTPRRPAWLRGFGRLALGCR